MEENKTTRNEGKGRLQNDEKKDQVKVEGDISNVDRQEGNMKNGTLGGNLDRATGNEDPQKNAPQ